MSVVGSGSDPLISDPAVATRVVDEAGLSVPSPWSPECDPVRWRRVADIIDTGAYRALANRLDDPAAADFFRVLSLRSAPGSFDTTDIVAVRVDQSVSDAERREAHDHIPAVLRHAFEYLPPATAGLVGAWIAEVTVYDTDHYHDVILSDAPDYGGMHRPHLRRLEVLSDCSNSVHAEPEAYPTDDHFSIPCTGWHEIGHAVHNVYGFRRPGADGNYYPDDGKERSSTGCCNPGPMSRRQKEFVLETFRAYARTHMAEYESPSRVRSRAKAHPVEAFAYVFEEWLRKGTDHVQNRYPQFKRVLELLV